MSYEKEEEERSEINRDHVVVRGCRKRVLIKELRKYHCYIFFLHPLPAKGGTPPMNRGRAPCGVLTRLLVALSF